MHDQQTDGPTDRQTNSLIEMSRQIYKCTDCPNIPIWIQYFEHFKSFIFKKLTLGINRQLIPKPHGEHQYYPSPPPPPPPPHSLPPPPNEFP